MIVLRIAPVWLVLLVVGGYSAVFGWRPGGFLMLAGVCGMIGGHLVVGVVEYRRTMRRPWPAVSPLDDEDDW
jgi:hypothetical protein